MTIWHLIAPLSCAPLKIAKQSVVTMEQSVRIAIEYSPKLRAARMEELAARASNSKEKPVAIPNVSMEVRGTVQGPRVTYPRPGGGDDTVLPERFGQAALTVDQLLYRPGAREAGERYNAQNRAARWEYLKAENDLILEVRKAYTSALAAEAQSDVARQGAKMASAQLEQTKLLLAAGTAMDRDVKASDSDLAEAEQSVLRAENGVTAAKTNLNRILGRVASSPLFVMSLPSSASILSAPQPAVDLALKRRPEIRMLEEQLRAARAGATLAATQDKPALSAQGMASTQTPSAFVRSEYFAASLVLKWNPFDTNKTRADAAEARYRVLQLEALLEDAKLGIKQEVEKARNDLEEAEARINVSERQVTAAESAAEVSRLRFQVRQALQLEVSGAQFNVTKARSNRVQAQFDLHLASADLAHASGTDVREVPAK